MGTDAALGLDHALGDEIAEADLPPLSKRVVEGGNDADRHADFRFDRDVAATRRIKTDADIDRPLDHGADDCRARRNVDRVGDARKLAMELAEHAGQEIARYAVFAGNGDVPAAESAQIVDLGDGAVEVALERQGMAVEHLARGCETHSFREPLEQLALKLVLELEDLPVDRGGRDVQRFRRLPHRAVPHRLAEISERDQVHMHEGRHPGPPTLTPPALIAARIMRRRHNDPKSAHADELGPSLPDLQALPANRL